MGAVIGLGFQRENRNIENVFLQEFSKKLNLKILRILENNLYIPQEIINVTDL